MSDPLVLAHAANGTARSWAARIRSEIAAAWPDRDLSPTLLEVDPRDAHDHGAVKALRQCLIDGQAQVALQDFAALPLTPAPGLTVAAVPMRRDAREALVTRSGKVLQYLGEGSRVCVDNPRRGGQLLRRRSDLETLSLAGPAQARLARLEAGDCDAFIAGALTLEGLGLQDRIAERFDHDQMVPAPGQAALALEVRATDRLTRELVLPLHESLSAFAVMAERSCLARLGGQPGDPVGVHAVSDGELMAIFGIVINADGTRAARMQWSGPVREAEDLGETLAELLIAIGGDKVLAGEPIPPTVRYSMQPGGSLPAKGFSAGISNAPRDGRSPEPGSLN